jgi:phage tail-like protein
MPGATRHDPYGSANFLVEIEGIETAGFHSVAGLDARIDVEEYREGGDRGSRKEPGSVEYGNIVLARGVTDDGRLFDWWRRGADGAVDRRDLAVVLLDRRGNAVARWSASAAWPVRYAVSPFDSGSDDVALEILELAHEGIVRDD